MTAGHIPGMSVMVRIHKSSSSNAIQGQSCVVPDSISFCCFSPAQKDALDFYHVQQLRIN